MIRPEIAQRVKKLYQSGQSIRWIARHLNLSRATVRAILREKPPPTTAAPPEVKRQSLLDPYKARVESLLSDGCSAALILRTIRKEGFVGGHTILDDFVRSRRGPQKQSRAFVRFETLPGEEAQQDWSPYRVSIDGKSGVIQLFSLILGWSRYQFLRVYRDQRFNSLLYGHVAAFRHFSGVPWRVVYDNQATITPFRIGGKPILNDQFSEFSKHYGFDVFVCLPGDKERKGKVERPFDYFEKAFLPTRIFHSFEDLNSQIDRWLSGLEGPGEGNLRKHGTTREVPYERWLEEKDYLYPLPATDHVPREVEERIVGPDLTISVLGNLYTVPPAVKGKKVWVSIGEGDLLVYDPKGEEVARHRLAEKKGGVVIDQAHYAALKRARKPIPLPHMESEFLGRFPSGGEFLTALKRTVSSIAPIHIREILALARRWRVEEVEAAMARALSDGTATAGYVREVLRRVHPTGHIADLPKEVPRGLSLGPIDCGEAGGYDGIFGPETKPTTKPETKE